MVLYDGERRLSFRQFRLFEQGQVRSNELARNKCQFPRIRLELWCENEAEIACLEMQMENAENQVEKRKFETALSYATYPLYATQVGFDQTQFWLALKHQIENHLLETRSL